MALPTYAEVAAKYELDICPACVTFSRHGHRTGFVDHSGTIHWDVQRVTRAGLHRFMVAIGAHYSLRPHGEAVTMWQILYRANKFAYEAALRDFGIRFPRRFFAEARAKVRWHLTHGRSTRANTPEWERLAAARWAEERRT